MATVVLGATLEELARNVANRRTVCAWIRSFGNTGALVRGPGRCPSADFSYWFLIGSGRAGSARNGGERAGAQPGRVVADAMRAGGPG